jgi:hypothetical protein
LKKLWLLLIPVLLLACTCAIPAFLLTPTPYPAKLPAGSVTQIGLTLARLHPSNGNLVMQLQSEVLKAAGLGQKPVTEFDATWCSSCQVVSKGLEEQDPQIIAAFDGVYLIRMDTDEWGMEALNAAGFDFDAIPVFFSLDINGRPTGDKIDGGAWGPDTYGNIASVMGDWFHKP